MIRLFIPIQSIHLRQLLILGLKEDYLYGILLLIALMVLYVCIKPVVKWLIHKRAEVALAYLLSSLFVLAVVFGSDTILSITSLGDETVFGLKRMLQWLGGFGGLLIVVNLYRFIISKQKRSI